MATLTPDSVGKAVVQNFFFLLGARIASVAVQFVAFAVLAAHLGPQDFGIYAFAIALAWMFRILALFGFETLGVREISQDARVEQTLIPDMVLVRALLAAASYLLLAALVVVGGYDEIETKAALVAGVTLLLATLETFGICLASRMRFGWPAVATVLEAVLSLLGIVFLVAIDADVLAFLWLYVGVKAASVAVLAAAAIREASLRWGLRVRSWPGLLRSAAPLAAVAVLITVYHRIDMTVLARLESDADVGQYGAASRLYETLLLIPALIGGVIQPVLGASFVRSRPVLERRYGRAMDATIVLALPVAVIGAMTAWRVVPELPGLSEYGGAGVALSILCVAAAFAFVSTIAQLTLIAGHVQRQLLLIAFVTVLVNLSLIAVLIPAASYKGAAISAAVTGAVTALLSIVAVKRRLGLSLNGERPAAAALASLAAAVAVGIGYLVHPAVQVALGVLVYALAAFATRAVRVEDLMGFFGRTEGPISIVVATPASEVERYARSLANGLTSDEQIRLILFHGGAERPKDLSALDVRALPRAAPLALWRALRGSSVCDVHVDAASPFWIPAVSRFAGCGRVVVTLHELPRARRRRLRFSQRLWEAFVDGIIVRSAKDAAAVDSASPGLRGRVRAVADDAATINQDSLNASMSEEEANSATAVRTLEAYRSEW